MALHAMIMAGGAGTRFWPLSRRSRPKQVLALGDERPLLRATFDRAAGLVSADRVWVVTGAATAPAVREMLPELPADNLLVEPVGRDTAACVGWAAVAALARDPDATCVVLPADHVIGELDRFRAALAAGAAHVDAHGGLLTFGIRPSRPETGYGYLRVGALERKDGPWPIHRLDRFVEKPDRELARAYLADGGYLWNSGMFAWRADELVQEIRRQLPLLADGLERLAGTAGAVDEVYPELPRISVDFGIMEGARRCWVVPVDFPWSDVGAWPALHELLEGDTAGTATLGRVLALDSERSLVIGEGPVVAAVGIRDMVVVATPDAVLVAPISEAQRVKEVVAALGRRGWTDVL